MLFQYWSNVYKAGPTLAELLSLAVNYGRFVKSRNIYSLVKYIAYSAEGILAVES